MLRLLAKTKIQACQTLVEEGNARRRSIEVVHEHVAIANFVVLDTLDGLATLLHRQDLNPAESRISQTASSLGGGKVVLTKA